MSQPSQASSSDTASHPNETTTQLSPSDRPAPKYPNLQKVDKVLLFPSPREWRIPGVYWPEEEELPQPAPYVEEPRLPRVRPPSDNYEEQLNWYRNNPNGIYHEDIDSGGLIPHAGAHTPPPEYFEERARISAAHAANAAANRRLISPTSPQDLAGEPTTPPPIHESAPTRAYPARDGDITADAGEISPTPPQSLRSFPTTSPLIHRPVPTRAYRARGSDYSGAAEAVSPAQSSEPSAPTETAYPAQSFDHSVTTEAAYPAQTSEFSAPTEAAYSAGSNELSTASEVAYPAQSFDHNIASETAYAAQSFDHNVATETAYPTQSFDNNVITETAYPAQSFDHSVATETAYPAQTSEFSAPTEAAYSAESNELSASAEAPPVAAFSSRRFEKSRVIDPPEEAGAAEASVAQPLASKFRVFDTASDPTWPPDPPAPDTPDLSTVAAQVPDFDVNAVPLPDDDWSEEEVEQQAPRVRTIFGARGERINWRQPEPRRAQEETDLDEPVNRTRERAPSPEYVEETNRTLAAIQACSWPQSNPVDTDGDTIMEDAEEPWHFRGVDPEVDMVDAASIDDSEGRRADLTAMAIQFTEAVFSRAGYLTNDPRLVHAAATAALGAVAATMAGTLSLEGAANAVLSAAAAAQSAF